MSQHTPGPWIHNPHPEPQNADRHICVDIPSGFSRVIARVKHTDVDNALANARLIAKAPEMLSLLRRLTGNPHDGMSVSRVVSDAGALLREIEGDK